MLSFLSSSPPDTLKGSFYNNPIYDVPTKDEVLIERWVVVVFEAPQRQFLRSLKSSLLIERWAVGERMCLHAELHVWLFVVVR